MTPNSMLIVWLPLTGFWGREEEIERRNQLAEEIEEQFHQRKCGEFDGRDTGMGSTNLYFCPIVEDRWDEAIEIVVETLRRWELAAKAIVARCDFALAESGEYEPIENVVWPPDYQGQRPW